MPDGRAQIREIHRDERHREIFCNKMRVRHFVWRRTAVPFRHMQYIEFQNSQSQNLHRETKSPPTNKREHSPKPKEQVFSTDPALRVIMHPKKGRSVQAMRDFKKGDLIERCPVIFIPNEEIEHIQKTALNDFIYPWTGFQFDGASLMMGIAPDSTGKLHKSKIRTHTKNN